MRKASYLRRLSRRGLVLAQQLAADGAEDSEITQVLREVSDELNQLAPEYDRLLREHTALLGRKVDEVAAKAAKKGGV